ncbi:MAG: TolC family protein [bacterium]|nr:TolC family protein [bacterium]
MRTIILQICILATLSMSSSPVYALSDSVANRQVATEIGPDLSLAHALELATQNSPRLAAARAVVERSEALRRQAGKFTNPDLEVELENLGATDGDWLDGAESAFRITQTLELGGKRGHRKSLATLEMDQARLDLAEMQSNLAADVSAAYIALLVAQASVELHVKALTIAEELHNAVVERVQSGKVPSLEEVKSSVELAEARIASNRSIRVLRVARAGLAATWGVETFDFGHALGDLTNLGEIPAESRLDSIWRQSPAVARLELLEEIGRVRVRQERGLRIPDLNVSAGLTRSLQGNDKAYVLALELPLPLFDRNTDGIAAADAELRMTSHEVRDERLVARSELGAVYRELLSLREEVRAVSRSALPAAERALAVSREGYSQGKFGLLELLDAQRTLLSVQEQQIESLGEYHDTINELEHLIGGPLVVGDPGITAQQGR